jgi:hypothetical protein
MKSSVVNYCLTNAVPLPTDPTLLAPLLELLELLTSIWRVREARG